MGHGGGVVWQSQRWGLIALATGGTHAQSTQEGADIKVCVRVGALEGVGRRQACVGLCRGWCGDLRVLRWNEQADLTWSDHRPPRLINQALEFHVHQQLGPWSRPASWLITKRIRCELI